jgi:hypothetical protein
MHRPGFRRTGAPCRQPAAVAMPASPSPASRSLAPTPPTLASTTASGAVGSIIAATLQYVANTASRAYGMADPALSGTATGYQAWITRPMLPRGTLAFTRLAVGGQRCRQLIDRRRRPDRQHRPRCHHAGSGQRHRPDHWAATPTVTGSNLFTLQLRFALPPTAA